MLCTKHTLGRSDSGHQLQVQLLPTWSRLNSVELLQNGFKTVSVGFFFFRRSRLSRTSSLQPCQTNARPWSPQGCAVWMWLQRYVARMRTPPKNPAPGRQIRILENWTRFSVLWCQPSSQCSALCYFWEQVRGACLNRFFFIKSHACHVFNGSRHCAVVTHVVWSPSLQGLWLVMRACCRLFWWWL